MYNDFMFFIDMNYNKFMIIISWRVKLSYIFTKYGVQLPLKTPWSNIQISFWIPFVKFVLRNIFLMNNYVLFSVIFIEIEIQKCSI